MANKLYEENSIKDIANAIRSINGEQNAKYTVAEMGNAIRGTRRVYKGEIKEEIKGSSVFVKLAEDAFLAEHRDDENLFVRVDFDIEPTPYTIAKSWCAVSPLTNEMLTGSSQQTVLRYNSSGNVDVGYPACKINDDAPSGVGCVLITEEGELLIHSMSSNFAIRPSNYTVIVEC